jgi:hypothetical protein
VDYKTKVRFMSKKLVTPNQVQSVQQMANAKGLGRKRFQDALDDGTISRFLDRLKNNPVLVFPPQGARIHVVSVQVEKQRPWKERILAGCPDTNPGEKILTGEVESQYHSCNVREGEEHLVLIHFLDGYKGRGGAYAWRDALLWAQSECLCKTTPQEVFCLVEQHPNLCRELNLHTICAVSTIPYADYKGQQNDNACYASIGDLRYADIIKVIETNGSSFWFVFRKHK